MSGIRGDFRTYTSFRCLISDSNTETIVKWVWHLALPLLVSLFAPQEHRHVLSAVSTINIDAGLVQEQVLKRYRKQIWPNGKLRFCYYHEIKQKFQSEVLADTPAKLQHALKTEILGRLKYLFTRCESEPEQNIVYDNLKTAISELACGQEMKQRVFQFCKHKFGKWFFTIGLV